MTLTHRASALMISLIVTAGLATSPASARLISEKQELQMGRDAARQVERQYKVSSDPQMNALVSGIGTKLARVSERPGIAWTFKVVDSKDVNAFAVPGYVYVTSGLINFVNKDPDQLAAVIGHEIGHTTGRHAVKQVEKQFYGGALLGLIFGGNASTMVNVAANLALLGYSRKDEYNADERGVKYAYKAGYNPNAMVSFFKQLQAKEGGGGTGLSRYFKTHPPTSSRITRAQTEIAELRSG